MIIIGLFAFWKWKQNKGQRKVSVAVGSGLYGDAGSQSHSWSRLEESQTDIHLDRMNDTSPYHTHQVSDSG